MGEEWKVAFILGVGIFSLSFLRGFLTGLNGILGCGGELYCFRITF